MTISAAAFIEALHRRWRLTSYRGHVAGEFPDGWKTWFEAMKGKAGRVTGAPADALVDVLLARPAPVPPARAVELSRWEAFATLWRQQWHPAAREDRVLRWGVAAFSVLLNLFFAVALVWLMYLQFLGLAPPPQGEQVVQVEFMGRGTPAEEGGGAGAEAPAESPSRDGAAESPQPQQDDLPVSGSDAAAPELPAVTVEAAVPVPELAGPPLTVPEREVRTPSVAESPPQRVTVSEPVPDSPEVLVLPPTRSVDISSPVAARELQPRAAQVQEREVAAPIRSSAPVVDTPMVTSRPLAAREPQVVEREVAAPVQAPAARPVAARLPAARDLTARTDSVREREVKAPSAPRPSAQSSTSNPPAQAASARAAREDASRPLAGTAAATAPSAAPSAPGTPGRAAATQTSAASSSQFSGSGPKAESAPGSWATPARGDDWGASTRNVPGAQRGVAPGVFNADGSVRVPQAPGSAAPGMPPGTVTQEIANLDRAGTWLKRKPNDFEPTAFDKYWVPNETLLAEWVRKSIKEVLIPIPGTSKQIRCAVALLALGGACGISDPNLNDQPATARPPPDVPFKPHLQEDNGSLPPAPPGS